VLRDWVMKFNVLVKVGSTRALYSDVPGFKPQHRMFGPIISVVSCIFSTQMHLN